MDRSSFSIVVSLRWAPQVSMLIANRGQSRVDGIYAGQCNSGKKSLGGMPHRYGMKVRYLKNRDKQIVLLFVIFPCLYLHYAISEESSSLVEIHSRFAVQYPVFDEPLEVFPAMSSRHFPTYNGMGGRRLPNYLTGPIINYR